MFHSIIFLGDVVNPVGIYLLKINNKYTRKMCEICSKLTINIPERRQRHGSGVFIVNLEHISLLALVFLFLTLSMSSLLRNSIISLGDVVRWCYTSWSYFQAVDGIAPRSFR